MARAAHQPTDASRRQVEAMAGYGVPEWDIAKVLGIDPKTLRKHYPAELELGHVKANARVAESLFKKAIAADLTAPAVNAAIFWLKTRAGWREPPRAEELGKKEVQHAEAQVAHVGSDWERILN